MVCADNMIEAAVAEKLGSVPSLTTLDLSGMQHAGAAGQKGPSGLLAESRRREVHGVGVGEGSGVVALRVELHATNVIRIYPDLQVRGLYWGDCPCGPTDDLVLIIVLVSIGSYRF